MPSIGFGIERIGLAAIRHPVIALLLVAAFSAACAVGLTRIKTEQTLSELFRSDTPAFADYKKLSDRFPTSEFDVMVVAEGPGLLRPESLEAVRKLHEKLESLAPVDGVISIFSMRNPPDEAGKPSPLFPDELPRGEAFAKLMEQVRAHPLVGGKMLSKPDAAAPLTLLVVSLKPDVPRDQGLFEPIREIEKAADELLKPAGLEAHLAGVPVMQVEIDEAMFRDQLTFTGSGFLVGFLISLAFFRRLKLVIITALCPALAVLWAIGLIGWLDLKLNTFVNVIPPLVMVITFTDSMHMVFSIRRLMKKGVDRLTAAREAVLIVGPACVLTSLTTSIAFLSLTLADSGLIRTFGSAAALATLLAFVAVIVALPPLVVLSFRDEAKFLATEERRYGAIAWLERLCAALAAKLLPVHRGIAVLGYLLVILCAALHLQLEPRFRLSDQVPDTKQSVAAAERIDAELTGAHPVHIMVRWPEGGDIASAKVLRAVSQSHDLLEGRSGIGNVWSVETLRRRFAFAEDASGEVLKAYLDKLPDHLLRRFVNEDARSAVVTGRMPDLDSKDAAPVIRAIETDLEDLRKRHPGFEFTVSGLSAVAALQSSSMISQLNQGLLVAIVVVIGWIGVAFRSTRIAILSVIPNLLPVAAAGAAIHLAGGGLEYATVIALTVAFGIAVDDSIHFLNRLRVETDRTWRLDEAVQRTISRIGPVLVLTTVVMVIGLAVTLLSDLPTMRLFGALFITTLTAALLADVIVLPAVVLAVGGLRPADAEATPLHGKALREAIEGRTVYLPSGWGFEVPVVYDPCGTMQGRVNGFADTVTGGKEQCDTGSWWISDGHLRQRWSRWLGGRPHSYRLVLRGKVLYWHRDDGRSGTARLDA